MQVASILMTVRPGWLTSKLMYLRVHSAQVKHNEWKIQRRAFAVRRRCKIGRMGRINFVRSSSTFNGSSRDDFRGLFWSPDSEPQSNAIEVPKLTTYPLFSDVALPSELQQTRQPSTWVGPLNWQPKPLTVQSDPARKIGPAKQLKAKLGRPLILSWKYRHQSNCFSWGQRLWSGCCHVLLTELALTLNQGFQALFSATIRLSEALHGGNLG